MRPYQHVKITVADQVMVSCGNFLFGVLLARATGMMEFGRFTLAWLVVDLLASFQFSLILQPMLNIGPKQADRDATLYFGSITVQAAGIAVGSGIIVALVAGAARFGFGLQTIGHLALPLVAAVMVVQSHDYVRRYFFARERFMAALLVDAIRYVAQLGGILALSYLWPGAAKSAAFGLWIIAFACAAGTAIGAAAFDRLAWDATVFREVVVRHWQFSKWLLPSTLMNAALGQIFLLVAGWVLGVATVGMMNIAKTALGFMNVLLLALNNFAPVRASRTLHLAGHRALRRYIRRLGLATLVLTMCIITAVAIFPDVLIRLIYGQRFIDAIGLVRWYGAVYFFYSMSAVLVVWAAASERTKPIFLSYAVAATVGLLAAYPLARFGGIFGIMTGMVGAEIVRMLMLGGLLIGHEARATIGRDKQRPELISSPG